MKVRCPYHPGDDTPSMHLYADHGYCYACGTSKPLAEVLQALGDPGAEKALVGAVLRPPEDLAASLARIKALPVATVRGLQLHTDASSYYVLWPNAPYYKKRYYDTPEGRGKYLCPSGHPTPLLVANVGIPGRTLLIVEGEINALSLAAACPELGVCSPGAASNFYSPQGLRHIPYYATYHRQVLVADEDAAGAMACIELAGKLRLRSSDVQIVLMKKQKHGGKGDANEILTQVSKQALREETFRAIQFAAVSP